MYKEFKFNLNLNKVHENKKGYLNKMQVCLSQLNQKHVHNKLNIEDHEYLQCHYLHKEALQSIVSTPIVEHIHL